MASPTRKVAVKKYSERVEVAGVRPATFGLVEWAPDSFRLLRGSRRIGDAAVDGKTLSARFRHDGKEWRASGMGASDLLKLVGTFILAHDARDAAAAPVGKAKGRVSKDEKISLQFLERAQALRLAEIDDLIADCRKRVKQA